ncbi:MAG: response regulator [Fimbriimonas sp.]
MTDLIFIGISILFFAIAVGCVYARKLLRASLGGTDYDLSEAVDGQSALREVATNEPDIVLLDLGLPDMDGLEVTRRLREWTQVPIIVLSARGMESDKVSALDAGADDYLTKPFSVNELMARVRVALRHKRTQSNPQEAVVIQAGSLSIDLPKRQVFVDGVEIHLTPIEWRLLSVLARHAGLVLTHRQLLEEAWGPSYADELHYLRVYMAQLRRKIEPEPANPRWLTTETGVGYRLRA